MIQLKPNQSEEYCKTHKGMQEMDWGPKRKPGFFTEWAKPFSNLVGYKAITLK